MLKNKQSKRILLALCCLMLALALAVVFANNGKSGIIVAGSLSERSREFLQAELERGSTSWKNRLSDNIGPVSSDQSYTDQSAAIATNCYSFKPPFRLRSIEKVDRSNCLMMLRVSSPPSRVTIQLSPLTTHFEENTAISMRTATPETYTPTNFSSSSFPSITVFTDPQGVSFFTQVDQELLTIVFSETGSQDSILQAALPNLLAAIKILPPSEREVATTGGNIVE